MDTLKLGHIIESEQHRDAVHVAVAPVYAAERLSPGQHVGLISGSAVGAGHLRLEKSIGIVDPFLGTAVLPGDRFWLFLYPGSITSLRHDWTHPTFEALKEVERQEAGTAGTAESRLRAFADEVGLSYGRLLAGAEAHIEDGEYMRGGGEFEGISMPATFWQDYEAVSGNKAPDDKRGHFFSCSC